MDLEKYRTLFVDEATEHLAEMSNAVTTLEKRPSPDEASAAVDCLFRMAHSIKGMAGSLEYHAPEALAHKLEDWMEPLRDGGEVDAAGIALLYDTVSALENMVRVVSQSGDALDPRPDLIERLSAPPSQRDSAESEPSQRERSGRSAEPRRGSGSDRATDAARPEGPEPAPSPLPPTLRVRAETMDRFLAGVGDLMQRHARVEALVTHVPDFAAQHEIAEELERMEFVARDLQRRALEIRTTPMRHLFERVPRLASELARRLGKRVEVQLGGEEVEVDRAVRGPDRGVPEHLGDAHRPGADLEIQAPLASAHLDRAVVDARPDRSAHFLDADRSRAAADVERELARHPDAHADARPAEEPGQQPPGASVESDAPRVVLHSKVHGRSSRAREVCYRPDLVRVVRPDVE